MKARKTERGFVIVTHPAYGDEDGAPERLIQESSAIGDDEDSFDNPGSSYLWVGENHHLNREEVRELISRLEHWLNAKRLAVDK